MATVDNSPEAVAARLTAYKQAKQAAETAKPFSNEEAQARKDLSRYATDGAVQKELQKERQAAAAAKAASMPPPTPTPAVVPGTLNPPPASSAAQANPAGAAAPSSPATDSAQPQTFDNSQGATQSAPQTRVQNPNGETAILCARGTTMLTHLGANSQSQTAGYYAIEEWTRQPLSENDLQDAPQGVRGALARAPVLFIGVQVSRRDVFSQTLCLNNIKVFYSFGQNFGNVTITGEILLGNSGNKMVAENTVKTFADFFWKYRVSNYLYPVSVSAVDEAYMVYLVGMDFADIIPEVHILPFVLHGVLLDVSRNDSKKLVNPSNQVLTLTSAGIYNSSIAQALAKTTSVEIISDANGKKIGNLYKNPDPKKGAAGTPGSKAIDPNTQSPAGLRNRSGQTSSDSGASLVSVPYVSSTNANLLKNADKLTPEAMAAQGMFAKTSLGKSYLEKQQLAVEAEQAVSVAELNKVPDADLQRLKQAANKSRAESDKAGQAAKNDRVYKAGEVSTFDAALGTLFGNILPSSDRLTTDEQRQLERTQAAQGSVPSFTP